MLMSHFRPHRQLYRLQCRFSLLKSESLSLFKYARNGTNRNVKTNKYWLLKIRFIRMKKLRIFLFNITGPTHHLTYVPSNGELHSSR